MIILRYHTKHAEISMLCVKFPLKDTAQLSKIDIDMGEGDKVLII